MKYTMGSNVFSDGTLLGQIHYLIVDPRSYEATHLVIDQNKVIIRKIIALEDLEIHTNRAIVMSRLITWESLTDYQPSYYQPGENTPSYLRMPLLYLHPLYYYPPIEPLNTVILATHLGGIDAVQLRQGVQVYDNNGQPCGKVISVHEDAARNVTHIVIQIVSEREIHAPLSWVLYTALEGIYLNVSCSRFGG